MAARLGAVTVALPELHAKQLELFGTVVDWRAEDTTLPPLIRQGWAENAGGRFLCARCGRRFGKSLALETWVAKGAIKGQRCGWFAPNYKYIREVYQDLVNMLSPVLVSSSQTQNVLRTTTGGLIDFWTLEDDRAGRSRFYDRVVIDEGAFAPKDTLKTWERSIKPALLDTGGRVIVASNTNGVDDENFFYQLCQNAKHGFIEFHARSIDNPTIPKRFPGESEADHAARRLADFAEVKRREDPLVFTQEYEAEFVDWSGVAFFARDKLLVAGQPLPFPPHCDYVYAVIDSATKTGSKNDGTAVTYFALSRFDTYPLRILDWDIVQIEGALLETWLPNVLERLEELQRLCGARLPSPGAFIEDAASGMILLQQARLRNLPAHAIESKLTAVGKDERAISVSGYVYRENVKFCEHAYNKVVEFKKMVRNHLLSQVVGFRIGDPDAAKRADDLLDTFTYGIALGLGDSGGF